MKESLSLLVLLIIIIIIINSVYGQQQQLSRGGFVDNSLRGIWRPEELLSNIYNNQQAPYINSTPVHVEVSLQVISLQSIQSDLHHIGFKVEQTWNDYRLQLPRALSPNTRILLDKRWYNILWIPTIHFSSATKESTDPLIFVTITNRTNVHLTSKITIEIKCSANLGKYPFDDQICDLQLMTYSETNDALRLKWSKFQINPNLINNDFIIKKQKMSECTIYDKFSYSCLEVHLSLSRYISSYLLSHYLPTFLLTLLSFASFYLPTHATSPRVTLSSLPSSILVIITATTSHALNIWCLLCLFFTIITTIWIIIGRWDWELEKHKLVADWFNGNGENCCVDMIARVFFPGLYALVIFIYILCYLI